MGSGTSTAEDEGHLGHTREDATLISLTTCDVFLLVVLKLLSLLPV